MAEEKLPASLEEYQAELNAIADIEGTLSPEQIARYEALEKGMTALRASQAVKARNQTWNKPSVSIVPNAPKGDKAEEYAFERYLRGDLGAAKELIYNAGDKPNMARYDQTLTTTAGGYLIPTTTEARIVEVMKNFGGIATVAEELPTAAGNPINYPTNDDTANSAEIDAVNTAMSSAGADLVFGQVTLGAYSYMSGGASNAALHVPFELAQDSLFPIVPFVSRKLGTRIGRKQAVDFATGTGSGQPKGLFRRVPDVNLTSGNFTIGGSVTASYIYGELLGTGLGYPTNGLSGVVYTLDPDYLPNASWVMRYSTLGALASLTTTTGVPLFVPQNQSSFQDSDMTSGSTPGAPDSGGGYRPAGRLLGYPVIVDQAAPAVANATAAKPGNAGDAFISFGDHRQAYIIRRVQGITLLVDPYTTMNKRQIGYFAWARADATIQNSAAHVLLAGWNAA